MKPQHLLRRFGLRSDPRWGMLALAVLAIGFAVWAFPNISPSSSLVLVARGAGGEYGDSVRVPSARAVRTAGGGVRVPLQLALRNTGQDAVRPGRIQLSVPAQFRLRTAGGEHLTGALVPGDPLIRYTFDPELPTVAPGGEPVPLVADSLWLVPAVPDYYCTLRGDQVPEFFPASAAAYGTLSTAQLFYSIEGGGLEARQTGVLSLSLDPSLFTREPAPEPAAGPVRLREPALPLPELPALTYVGSRYAECGPPSDPLTLLSTLWETPAGGRFLVLSYGGAPRKYLFDLDGDGIVELVMWDPDGDGRFEAARRTRFALPDYLIPRPEPERVPAETLPADTPRPDTLPPLIPDSLRPDTLPPLLPDTVLADTAAPDTIAPDTVAADTAVDIAPPPEDTGPDLLGEPVGGGG